MTKKDFFRIVIKILGLYLLIITIFSLIPAFFNFVPFMDESTDLFHYILITISFLLIAVFFILFIIIKSDSIIRFLKLDKGFDDDFIKIGNLDSYGIMRIAVILIGGFLIIENIPVFLNYAYQSFKNSAKVDYYDTFKMDNQYYFKWIVSGLSMLIGYLLMTNFRIISKWLTKSKTND